MTLAEFKTIIASTGISCGYYQFPEGEVPALPFLVWFETETNNFGADNKVHKEVHEIAVEFYAKVRDLTNEGSIETVFANNGIFWNKEITYLDDEKCFETIYTLEV